MSLKEIEIKELFDKNFMFLTMLGYGLSIMHTMEDMIKEGDAFIDDRLQSQITWFKTAIDNIVYKDIPPPQMP